MSFMNEMRVASMALAAYLVSSAERRSITSMRSLVRMNGAYSARSISMARLSLGADDHAVRLHEVVDRVALLQELGVGGDRELVLGPLADDRLDLVAGADGDGRLGRRPPPSR